MNTPVDNGKPAPKGIAARIRAIEQRWGKTFEEVLIDMHDHIFGASPPATGEGTASAQPPKAPAPNPVPVADDPAGQPESDTDDDGDEGSGDDSSDDSGDSSSDDSSSDDSGSTSSQSQPAATGRRGRRGR